MPKPAFKTRDAALASLKAVSFVDEFYAMKKDADGNTLEDGDGDAIWETKERFPEVFAHPDHDKGLVLSAEDGGHFANCYGQFDDSDDPWVHPLIEAWAEKHDYQIEWRDAGSVTLFPN